jgi:thiamine biosynthesis protein ThiS
MNHEATKPRSGLVASKIASCVRVVVVHFFRLRRRYHFGMTVKVNGEEKDLPDGTTLRELVTSFKLTPEKVAIELNRRLVRSEKYDTPLKNGDEVEIVTFVGGG